MDIAVTRQVSRSIVNCELTFLSREPVDVARAQRQHAQYEATLKSLGLAVLSLPEEPDLPDSVFVEDTALVLDECAVIARPGAASRLPEVESIRDVLAPFRQLLHIRAPGTLDGGDILRIGSRLYIGLSQRSNNAAVIQMRDLLAPHRFEVNAVPVHGCLHLKSAVTEISPNVLLVNPAWVNTEAFGGVTIIEIDPSEAHAANALRCGDLVVCSAAFPRTRARLEQAGMRTIAVEADELAKAEGGLTCCSLIFRI